MELSLLLFLKGSRQPSIPPQQSIEMNKCVCNPLLSLNSIESSDVFFLTAIVSRFRALFILGNS